MKPATIKCHFSGCKAPVTHRVQRLWLSQGQPLPLTYCCSAHRPGSRSQELPPALRERLAQRPFYHVEPITLDDRHAIARQAPPPYNTRKQLRENTLSVGREKDKS